MVPGADSYLGKGVGGYTLIRLLGSGGTGSVYLGERAGSESAPPEQVAIKLLVSAMLSSPDDRAEFQERFRREARALERLRNPHILSILAYGEDEAFGLPYLVLPYVRGGTLASQVASGPLPLAETAQYGEQLAEALGYAHTQGIVHRDVKPANVLVDDAGQLLLADFGIAKIFDPAGTTLVTLTGTGQVMGTADYMAPEQAKGEEVGPAADVYSLAMVLYHLVTGRVPFEGKSLTQVLLQIAQEPPTPPRRLRPDLPPPAEAALLRGLAKKPADRFTTPSELAAAFAMGVNGEWAPGLHAADTLAEFVPSATRVAPALDRPAAAARLRRASRLTLAVVALVLLSVTTTLLLSGTLLPKGGLGKLLGGGQSTSTATAAPATARVSSSTTQTPPTATPPGSGGGGAGGSQSTATPTAASFSYFAAAPGPGCDGGGANWHFLDTNGSNYKQCLSAPARLHLVGFNCSFCQGTTSRNEVEWDSSAFPSTLIATVTVSNLNYAQVTGAYAWIGIGSGLNPSDYQYYFEDPGNGTYWVSWCHNGCYILFTGHTDTTVPITFTVMYGQTLTWSLDGQQVYAESGAGLPSPTRIFLQVGGKVSTSPAADFSSFQST
jgi:serine/threonine-protein kinase